MRLYKNEERTPRGVTAHIRISRRRFPHSQMLLASRHNGPELDLDRMMRACETFMTVVTTHIRCAYTSRGGYKGTLL